METEFKTVCEKCGTPVTAPQDQDNFTCKHCGYQWVYRLINTVENTPAHCHDCDKLSDCHQAQNMTSDTEAVCGFVETVKFVDYFCADCTPDNEYPDLEFFPMDNQETDSPCHCSICGTPLIHTLTNDGINYVLSNLYDGCTRELWPVVWFDVIQWGKLFKSNLENIFKSLCDRYQTDKNFMKPMIVTRKTIIELSRDPNTDNFDDYSYTELLADNSNCQYFIRLSASGYLDCTGYTPIETYKDISNWFDDHCS